ncbi:MAG: ester cyclase [Actinomycetota bacterium]
MGDPVEVGERYDDAFNAHDAETRRSLLTDESELVLPGGMRVQGPDEILGVTQAFWTAFPDGKLIGDRHVSSGSDEATEGHFEGTHDGPFSTPQGEVPASGNRVRFDYASFRRIEGGQIVSERLYFDQMEFLQQIGALPAPPE